MSYKRHDHIEEGCKALFQWKFLTQAVVRKDVLGLTLTPPFWITLKLAFWYLRLSNNKARR